MTWLIPPILVVITAVTMIAVFRAVPTSPLIPEPLNYVIGIPLAIAGLGLAAAGARRFRDAGTNIHTFRAPDLLVEDGLFALSRNPMYLGFALAILGFAVKLNEPLNLVLVAGFVTIVDRWYIRYEETVALAQFGRAYEDYCRRTRRWI